MGIKVIYAESASFVCSAEELIKKGYLPMPGLLTSSEDYIVCFFTDGEDIE